ncbi:transmembrane protein EpsG [Neobacillus niacini]|uniref:EpsG family protein n=1 Tax=Neobacillus niacini TaxID=86668 RepID=UPI00277EF7F3|nr:EpsG family protein [Neobacillus niacini]MDQ1000335.1 transmembrane protein EpsG [Neobacillus niacini]
MSIYMFNLLFVYFWSWLSSFYGKKDISLPIGYRPNNLMVYISIVSLVLVSGLRYGVGTDYWTYSLLYNIAGIRDLGDIIGWGESETASDSDVGFIVFLWVLNKITDNPQLMFLITALITNILIVRTLRDYVKPFELGIFLYICTFNYYSTFNGVRQYLVAAVIFWSFRYLITGNWKKYFTIIILSSTFHASALIMIPVYFIVRRKAWTSFTFVLTLCFVLAAMLYNKFISLLMFLIKNTQYGHYEEWFTNNSNGMNIIKIFVLLIPLVISYLYRNKIREIWPDGDYVVNLCIINFLFGLLATRDFIFARFSIYFGLYQLLLIPIFTRLFDKKTNTLIYFILAVCFFVYSYMLLPVDSNVLPYKSIFSK